MALPTARSRATRAYTFSYSRGTDNTNGRLYFLQVGGDGIERFGVIDDHARLEQRVIHHALIAVATAAASTGTRRRPPMGIIWRDACTLDQMFVVRQHHALRIARRARRIDQRRQILGTDAQCLLLPSGMLRRGRLPHRLERGERRDARPLGRGAAVERHDVLEPGNAPLAWRILSSCSAVEQNAATDSESRRMYSVCLAVRVG